MDSESISSNQVYIYELAVSIFGSESKANEWHNQYHPIFRRNSYYSPNRLLV